MTAAKITAFAMFTATLGLWAIPVHAANSIELGATSEFMQQQEPKCKKGWIWNPRTKKCVRQTRGSY